MCRWCDLYTVDALIWMNIPVRSFISHWGPLYPIEVLYIPLRSLIYIPLRSFISHWGPLYPIEVLYIPLRSFISHWGPLYPIEVLYIPLRSFISHWGPLLRNLQGFRNSKWSISSNKSTWQDCTIFFMELNLNDIAIHNMWWTTPPHDYKAF